jgi:carbonic anhydrase
VARSWLLGLGIALALADSSVVTLALPDILARFELEIAEVAWVLTSYNLVLALAAVPAAFVARRRPGAAYAVGIVVFALASLETLLSASAADKMTSASRSNPDQELIGQGIGNIASALFGGIPVTGVIARTGANIQAGAKTRRASIFHSLTLLGAVFAFGPWMERIPIAALAGVLFSVAFRMLAPAGFLRLWRHARGDGMIYAITFITIVFVDLLEGIQWGVVAALAIAAIRLGRTRLVVRGARLGKHYLFALEGPLTFLSSMDVDSIREEVGLLESGRAVVFDLRSVATIDSSGAEMLSELAAYTRERGLEPLVIGLDGASRDQVASALGPEEAARIMVEDERALAQRLGVDLANADSRLRAGIERYRSTTRPRYAPLFERLATGQSPHTLLITCSDSRVDPSLITATDPGELFVVRDIGNLVPPASNMSASAVGGAIDFAVGILKVSKIVVCGHSGCGAIRALLSRDAIPAHLHHLDAWLEATDVRSFLRNLPRALDHDEVGKLNVLSQIDHLRTYPIVAEKLRSGEVSLAAWFFDVAKGEIEEWTDVLKRFVPVGQGAETLETAHAPASSR